MNPFQPFEMERWMSKYEQDVEFNLSESGVKPMTLDELLTGQPESVNQLLKTELNYPHANGSPLLREHIAAMYPGTGPENILVTVGAIEANLITVQTLLSPGDEIIVMLPNYMQIWGIAKNFAYTMKSFHLREDRQWSPDLSELEAQLSEHTKLIAVCNPNNPTGYILTEKEMQSIIRAADTTGAWILADEVYSGAERLTDRQTDTFYGQYDKVIAVGSTSKAYGLPGLRIGWLAGPAETVEAIWARHEYTTISASMLSNTLATLALSPRLRPKILARTREYIRSGFKVLEDWLLQHPGLFRLHPPQAAAIAFPAYNLDINSFELTEMLRREHSVMIVPGDFFGMDGFLRISFGLPHNILQPALDRLHMLIERLQSR